MFPAASISAGRNWSPNAPSGYLRGAATTADALGMVLTSRHSAAVAGFVQPSTIRRELPVKTCAAQGAVLYASGDPLIAGPMEAVLEAGYPVHQFPADDPQTFRAVFGADWPFLLVDAHNNDDDLPVGMAGVAIPPLQTRILILGSCKGAQTRVTRALEERLSGPTAVLASPSEIVRFEHATWLWPYVLNRANDLVTASPDAHEAARLLEDAVRQAHHADRRHRLNAHWTVRVLHPRASC